MGLHARKISNDISYESAQHIHSQTSKHTPREGLYQSCLKNCEIFIFGFFCLFFFFIFFSVLFLLLLLLLLLFVFVFFFSFC